MSRSATAPAQPARTAEEEEDERLQEARFKSAEEALVRG